MKAFFRLFNINGFLNAYLAFIGCILLFVFSAHQELKYTFRDASQSIGHQSAKMETALSDGDMLELKFILRSFESQLIKEVWLRNPKMPRPLNLVAIGFHDQARFFFSEKVRVIHNGRDLGEIEFFIYFSDLVVQTFQKQFVTLFCFFLLAIFSFFFSNFRMGAVLSYIHDTIEMIKGSGAEDVGSTVRILEAQSTSALKRFGAVGEIKAVISGFMLTLIEAMRIKEFHIRTYAINEVSRQVAHDIRSPLTALESILGRVHGMPTDQRTLLEQAIFRIRAIADDLLENSKELHSTTSDYALNDSQLKSAGLSSIPLTQFEINSSLLEIINEKKISFEMIKFKLNGLDEKLSAFGSKIEFERLVANIIQNSIDAVRDNENAQIQIAVRKYGKKIQILVMDNGIGIPSEILNRVGERGFSFGKSNGNGLGVSHAKSKLQEWGGDLQIASQEGQGTIVTLILSASFCE